MAPRAYWKGHIRLALVSFPVRLYAATTSTERISLNRIHRETGERVRQQNVVPGEGPVDRDDIVMGYEYDRDRYVPVEDEELDALQVESKHTIDLSRFVELSDIDPIYFDKPYFMAPDGDIATEAFVTIRNALRKAKKVALGTIVLSKRERIVAIQPCGKGLLLETLRWADEVREADAYFEGIENVSVPEDTVEMAESLIAARTGPFEPETFVDTYQKELRALIQAKLKGKRPDLERGEEKGGDNVINLMDALKASLGDEKDVKGSKKKSAPKSSEASGKSGEKTATRRTSRTSGKSSSTKSQNAGGSQTSPSAGSKAASKSGSGGRTRQRKTA